MKSYRQRRAAAASGTTVRSRLLQATAELIAAEGVPAATSRAITDRAGENLASITYYFGSKQALVTEALVHRARSLIDPVLAALNSDQPQLDRLVTAVHALTGLFSTHRDDLPAYLECLAAGARDRQLAQELAALFRHLQRVLADDMARQQAEGQIPAWVDPPAMAQLIVALANGVIVNDVIDPQHGQPAVVGQQFTALLAASSPHSSAHEK